MTITEIISAVKHRLAQQQTSLIMVTGGSATGKSSQVLPQLRSAFGEQALLIEQDWYQQGLDYAERDDSPYRWDDPANFQVERLAYDLKLLKAGQAAQVPAFDVIIMRSSGTQTLKPRSILIIDGLYSLHGQLARLADYSIYIQMPLYGRFLRRLFRTLYDQKQDKPQTAFKQSLGTVLKAHQDIVSKQAAKADCIIDATYSFTDTIKRYHLSPQSLQLPSDVQAVWHDDKLAFYLQKLPKGGEFYICYNHQIYYHFFIENRYLALLDTIDFLST